MTDRIRTSIKCNIRGTGGGVEKRKEEGRRTERRDYEKIDDKN